MKLSRITHEDTQILKGVAILFLLFIHLFNKIELANSCQNYLYIGEKPLVFWITRAMTPVSMFIMLSGYGLRFSYEKGLYPFSKQIRRISKLYINYWIILLIFVSIGYLLDVERYANWESDLIKNLTGYNTTFDGPAWFLLPYSIIALFSKTLFKWMDKFGTFRMLFLSCFLYFSGNYILSRYISHNLDSYRFIGLLLATNGLCFSFLIGATIKKKKINLHRISPMGALCLLLLAFIIKASFHSAPFDPFYTVLFILLFLRIPRHKNIDKFLSVMGNHSMNMWLIHAFYNTFIFKDFIYGFKFPLLIFAVLIGCSFLSSIVIKFITKRVLAWTNL